MPAFPPASSLRAALAATVWLTAAGPSSLPAQPPPPPPLDSSLTLVSFQHYELNLPGSEGWELVSRACEDEAITVRVVWKRGEERFTLGEIEIGRGGLFGHGSPREPRAAFDLLAGWTVEEARRSALGRPGVTWLGSERDTLADGARTFHRIWYGTRLETTEAHTWVLYWFPESFARDGFHLRATLRLWTRPGREDVSIIDEFAETARSLRARRPELDPRIVPEVPDSLGRAGLSLPFVYYDSRAKARNSPLDTTRAPCWVQVEDSVAVGLQATMLPEVTFVSFRARPPAAGDRSPGERFGKAFDRDGDGRFDLLFLSQGWAKGRDGRDFRTFYTLADDNGDGRVDGSVYEDGDNDRDALVDHSLFIQDRARAGEPDRAWIFDTDIARPAHPVPHRGTVFLLTRTSHPGEEEADFAQEFQAWNRYMEWLNRAAASCRGRPPGRRP